MNFIFDLLAPQINVSKHAQNVFLVYSSAKDIRTSSKNMVFFLFCILVGRPMGGAIPPLPTWLRYYFELINARLVVAIMKKHC